MDISILFVSFYIGLMIYLANLVEIERHLTPIQGTTLTRDSQRATIVRWMLFGAVAMKFVYSLLILQVAYLGTSTDALKQLEAEIPADIAWVLRVDGHTDSDPVQNATFKSNWELSSARAITVVQYLISQGVSPKHLVAAGFGQFQPLAEGDSEDVKSENRRIELKLTER